MLNKVENNRRLTGLGNRRAYSPRPYISKVSHIEEPDLNSGNTYSKHHTETHVSIRDVDVGMYYEHMLVLSGVIQGGVRRRSHVASV